MTQGPGEEEKPARGGIRRRAHRPLALAVLFGVLCVPTDLSAQVLRGRVVDRATDEPVAGALLLLVGPSGEEVASAVTGESGTWLFRLPSPGEWSVHVERIGFATALSGPYRVAAAADRTVELSVSSAPVALPAITVESEAGLCRLDPEEGETVWRLWDEARKALRVAQITAGEVVFVTETVERFVDPWGAPIGREDAEYSTTAGRSPFRVPPADDLAVNGFVRDSALGGLAYYGPDAEVLLSDTFHDSHCFHAVPGEKGRVGLAFEPAREPMRVDVRGILWLDSGSSELREIEYGYVGLRPRDDLGIGPPASGRFRYDRIEGGGWIVREWSMRIPVDSRQYGGRTYKLYQEKTGRVTSVRHRTRTEPGGP